MKLALGRLGSAGTRTLIQRAIASLRARGSDAHLWLPGGDVRTYGPELVVNGGFDSDTGWTKSVGVTIAEGVAAFSAVAAGQGVYLTSVVEATKTYTVTYTIVTATSGSVAAWAGAWGTQRSTPGTYSDTISSTGANTFAGVFAKDSVFSGSIDNISVREITSITPTITSGLTTGNYLESTGNSVATVDNPVGLVLDALGSVGAELVAYPLTGSFGASWVVVGSTIVRNGSTGTAACVTAVEEDVLLSSKSFRVEFTVTGSTGDSIGVRCGGGTASGPYAGNGTFSAVLVGGGTVNLAITFLPWGGGAATATISSISVREVSGIHLTQATTANKPIVQRGLWNLLTYSSDFGNAAWTKTNVSVTPLQTGPSGASDATLISDTSTSGAHQFFAYYTPSYVHTVTMAAVVKYSGKNIVGFGGNWDYWEVQIDLQTGTVSGSGAASVTVVSVGNGYWLIARNSTLPDTILRVYMCTTSYDGAALGDGILAQKFALFQGTLTASQILAAGGIPVTTTAAGSNPDSGRYAWRFDGSNDSLALGSVPFNTQDDICVVAGTAIAADYANGAKIFGIRSANGNSIINLTIDASNTLVAQFRDESLAMLLAASSGNAFSGGVPLVASARKVGSTAIIRANSVTLGTTTLAVGASAFGANLPNIGSENATKYFKGSIGPVLTIKGTVSDAELLMYERLVAALTPGAPTF